MADWWRDEETVGELISRARLKLGKSQYALADALREASQRSDGAPDRGMVARWETGRGVPLTLFALPDAKRETNRFAIEIPLLGSLILTHDIDGTARHNRSGRLGSKAAPR